MSNSCRTDEPHTSDGEIHPKLVFSDDALVVDYLNSLLASAPANDPDSNEIQFVHIAAVNEWRLAKTTSVLSTGVHFFDADRLKWEANELRKENENLKFKTELAEIEGQVLRSENENLRVKLASLSAQMNETKSSYDSLVVQNIKYKSRLDCLQRQHDASLVSEKVVTSPVSEDSVISVAKTTEIAVELDLPGVDIRSDLNVVTVQREETGSSPVVQQQPDTIDISRGSFPDPEIVIQNNIMENPKSTHSDPELAILLRTLTTHNSSNQPTKRKEVVFSNVSTVRGNPFQNSKTTSNVIKQHDNKIHQSIQEICLAAKACPTKPAQYVDTEMDIDMMKPNSVLQQQVTDSDPIQEDGTLSNNNILHRNDSDEINVKPAPTPKVVVRKNVKNYEDLQNEADSLQTTTAEHRIVL